MTVLVEQAVDGFDLRRIHRRARERELRLDGLPPGEQPLGGHRVEAGDGEQTSRLDVPGRFDPEGGEVGNPFRRQPVHTVGVAGQQVDARIARKLDRRGKDELGIRAAAPLPAPGHGTFAPRQQQHRCRPRREAFGDLSRCPRLRHRQIARLAFERVAQHPHLAARRAGDLGGGLERLRRGGDDAGLGAGEARIARGHAVGPMLSLSFQRGARRLGHVDGPTLDDLERMLGRAGIAHGRAGGDLGRVVAVGYHDLRIAKEGGDTEQIAQAFD